jgi:hypothetical protein
MKQISALLQPPRELLLVLPILLLAILLLILPACNALNPLCGSSRPAPTISSLSDTTTTFSQVQQGFPLTVIGTQFVSSTVVLVNGTTLSTQVVNSDQLQVTITTAVVAGPGSESITVNTPSGNTGYAGCDSGGTSQALILTVF